MAITHIQDAGKFSGASSSVTVHLTTNTTATNTLILAACPQAGASIVSVNDTISGRWIQDSYSTSAVSGAVELWHSRGIQGGSASVTVVCSGASVGVNVSEWSSVWGRSPLDTWSQNFSTSLSVTPQTVTPRTTGDLVIAAGQSAGSVSGPSAGWTALSVPGDNGFAAAYQILSGSVVSPMNWATTDPSGGWVAVQAAYLPINSTTVGAATGPAQLNPLLQFPEVSVQISDATTSYLAPFSGTGSWTEVGSYVESMTLGGIGRVHELDRVQSSPAQFVMNGRDGTFQPWNSTTSFLWPGGLDPMTPIKVTAAWNGVTSPIYYGYAQSFDPVIIDSQNVNVNIATYDILQMLSLGYLSNNNYAQAVLAGA